MRCWLIAVVLLASPAFVVGEETEATFVTIQRVHGDRITVLEDGGGRGQGRAGGVGVPGAAGRRGRGRMGGRGRRGGGFPSRSVELQVSRDAKITSAMRERRTFEFRVGVELAGGLKNKIFENIGPGLSARVKTEGSQVVEINVMTSQTDINQTNTDPTDGGTVIAIRPKQPPPKRE